MLNTKKKYLLALTFATSIVGTTTINPVNADVLKSTVKPEGFDEYIVFLANGVIDTSVRSPLPGVENCNGLFCDGYYFQHEIMGRSDAEIEIFKEQAIEFFKTRFGIDVEDPNLSGRIVFRDFMTNPQWGYRLQTFAGRTVDSDGWPVRDGGYMVMITDPAGIDFGGEFAGVHGKQNQVMFYGNYNVLTEDSKNHFPHNNEELVMLFRSSDPAQINDDGSVTLRCEILQNEWGTGIALGNVANEAIDEVLLQGIGRNVITFKSGQ